MVLLISGGYAFNKSLHFLLIVWTIHQSWFCGLPTLATNMQKGLYIEGCATLLSNRAVLFYNVINIKHSLTKFTIESK